MNTITTRVGGRRNGFWRPGLCAALVCVATGSVPAGTAPGATLTSDNAEVSYRDPAKFTEMDRNPAERTAWLDDLSRYVVRRAARVLPAGQRLSVTITDVQRAGVFEPWRRGRLSEVRIVRDTAPPRIDLSFRLESAQGAALKQGERELRDIGFLTRFHRHSGETLAYEKTLIDAWMAEEFGPPKR